MNISELARKMRINPKDLPNILPEMGIDIGARAIKIDDAIATRVIREWPRMKRERESRARAVAEETERATAVAAAPKVIALMSRMSVRDFAEALHLPVTSIIRELMKNGILVAMNESIDYDTAAIVAEDLGYTVERARENAATTDAQAERAEEVLRGVTGVRRGRPPVIVVMGHVDHGKTKLLDAIRKTNVVAGEAGGITQHIGAYQVEKRGRMITFIDTPGHEAFTTMRSRGARIADIAILVVAADDGVQPQTIEALNIIRGAELPFVVALNKVDKPEANLDRVKQQLSEQHVQVEGWGGAVPAMPVSAKTGAGIDELLDTLVLIADMQKDALQAVYDTDALGTIIESHVDKGEGPVATMLIQAGVMRANDILAVDTIFYGKARMLKDFQGTSITEGTPGMPVKIIGLRVAPNVGDIVRVHKTMEGLDRKSRIRDIQRTQLATSITRPQAGDEKGVKVFRLIVKADVAGSLEAIILALEQRSHPEAKVHVIQKGLGEITDADVQNAETADALLVGFHVVPSKAAVELSREKGIAIRTYTIIYDLLRDVEEKLTKLLSPEHVRTDVAKIQVLEIFRHGKREVVLGGKVLEGRLRAKQQVTIYRKGEPIGVGKIGEIRMGKEVVAEAAGGQECGMRLETDTTVEQHDVLQIYTEESRARSLSDR